MLTWNASKLTTAGKALLAKAQAGQASINFTKAMTGSGSYSGSEDPSTRTALKTPKQTFPISSKHIENESGNGATLVLKIAITNKGEDFQLSEGYDIREFGIFARDPQNGQEILYSIAVASTSDYMPRYDGLIPSVINMSYYLEVANADNVTINSTGAIALQADLEALETRVSAIENNKMKVFGAKRKVGASSTNWEREGDAVGMTCLAAVGNEPVQNDMMAEYPFCEMRPCNLSADLKVNAYLGDADFQWDGSNGDVMLEVPQTYTGRWFTTDEDGVQWEHRAVSSGPVGRLKLDRAFIDGVGSEAKISDKIYIPIFNGSLSADGTKIESKAGAFPVHNKTRAQFRALATAKGAGWYLDDVWNMHLLDTLFICMFASSHAQQKLGKGFSEMPCESADNISMKEESNVNRILVKDSWAAKFVVGGGINIGTSAWSSNIAVDRRITSIEKSVEIEGATCVYFDGDPVNITTTCKLWSCCQPTGGTIQMASPNGRPEGVDGRTHVRFLWIEDWYGNMWQFRDGDNIKTWQHYYGTKRAEYADKKYDGSYITVGYEGARTNGYVSEFGYDPQWPMIEIATKTAGGSNSHFADYYYQAEGGEVVFSGGGVYHGVNDGPFFRSCFDGGGNSVWYVGGRSHARR